MAALTKNCTDCLQDRPLSEFHKRTSAPDGLAYKCKSCINARTRAWREANPDKAKESSRRHYEANRGRYREHNRRWVAENKDRHREYQRDYQRARHWVDVEHSRAKKRRWYHDTKGLREGNVRARTPDADVAWLGVLRKDPCAYCGSNVQVTVDHIVPVSSGGTGAWENLTAACKSCNSRKHTKSMLEFLVAA